MQFKGKIICSSHLWWLSVDSFLFVLTSFNAFQGKCNVEIIYFLRTNKCRTPKSMKTSRKKNVIFGFFTFTPANRSIITTWEFCGVQKIILLHFQMSNNGKSLRYTTGQETYIYLFTYHRYRYAKRCWNDPGQISVCSIKCIQDNMAYTVCSRL